jgi:hypothetical protein
VARLALALPLLVAGGAVLAQTGETRQPAQTGPTGMRPPTASAPEKKSTQSKSPQETEDIKKRVADWLKTCLEDWDRSTHMTKAEWHTTCRRVASDRGRFLIENPNLGIKSR